MQHKSTSERIIMALRQLTQYNPVIPNSNDSHALNVLSGVRAYPMPDPDKDGHGIIMLKYTDGFEAEVSGEMYLNIQITESERYEENPILREHLFRKYDL